MKEFKGTPGPWRFDSYEMKIKGTDDTNYLTVIANVSSKMNYSRGNATQHANAALITSAPAMLELLVEIRNNPKLWRSGGSGGQDQYAGLPPMIRMIDEAITKALGGN